MINMKHNLRRHILQAAFTLVGAATLGLVAAGGTASAADSNPVSAKISFSATINGNEKELVSADQYSNNEPADPSLSDATPINVDKASNIKENVVVTNTGATPQKVYDVLQLPSLGDMSSAPLINNSTVGKPTFSQPTDGPFHLGYKYPSVGDTYSVTYPANENLWAVQIGQDVSNGYIGPEELGAGQTLNLSVPLKVDTSNSNPSQLAIGRNSKDVQGYMEVTYSSPIALKIVHSITAKDFNDANYNSLWSSTNKGVVSLYDADGNAVSDVAKATVKSVTPTNNPAQYQVIYSYDGVDSIPVTATIADKTFIDAKDFTIPYGSNWDSQKFNGLTKHLGSDGNAVTPLSKDVTVSTNKAVDTTAAGSTYDVTYTIDGITKIVKVTVGQRSVTPSNNSNNNNSNTNNNGNSGNSAWNPSNPSNPNGTGLPNYAAVKGSAVYATKGIYMYRSANFTKSQRTATYPKAKRVNRPMFVVLGYDKSNGGALRYKVRDVNHGKKTAGKIGYITANPKYVVNVYYKTMPKSHKITVINKKGIHAYKNANLTGRAKTFKKGTHVTVKSFEKHNLTTRYKLSNGTYITANKKLVIQGNY
ncbi:DUF5776 domain-containing protein [Lentilactobacillus buchneri]|uniref:DUF5776 domain-containing protein n=1 Tax=Lentilactobacillus buchneri TaxID=1581 RepID=UPI0017830C32|nr:DUF5776 domain-containing protein [Lentilactobacillus buchneri]